MMHGPGTVVADMLVHVTADTLKKNEEHMTMRKEEANMRDLTRTGPGPPLGNPRQDVLALDTPHLSALVLNAPHLSALVLDAPHLSVL